MGNCLKSNNQISAQDEEYSEAVSETSSSSFTLEPEMPEESMQMMMMKKKKKKMVRFNLQSDDNNEGGKRSCSTNSRSGAVRIRLMVTRKELQRILRYENDTQNNSLQQLLCAVDLGRSTISEIREDDDGSINAWRPALESIPEDRSMK